MKQCLRFLPVCALLIAGLPAARAQIGFNSPAGIKPRLDAEVYTNNGFLVQQKYQYTAANPATSLTTLSCATSAPVLSTLAGILLDPGGAGNYSANQNCGQYLSLVSPAGVLGIELQFLELDTEAGIDQVLIGENGPDLLTYSGSTIPETIYIPGGIVRVRFVSNGNTTVGTGFRLQWRAVTAVPGTPVAAAAIGFGRAFYFDMLKGAVMGGYLTTGQVRNAGVFSTVFGASNRGSGDYSTIFGVANNASGYNSTAMGFNNMASRNASTATGRDNTASGNLSTAMGYRVRTGLNNGVFVIGDSDPLNQGVTPVGFPDQFVARFCNGYYLLTSGNSNRTGVIAGAGATSWSTISDSTRKERFLPINGPDLLRKISGMKLTTWNYKDQRDRRHYGPMA